MKKFSTLLLCVLLFCTAEKSQAQLIITQVSSAQALVQKLLGDGVTVTNVSLISNPVCNGFFRNVSGTNIGLDSGIVLTNGRAKTAGASFGLDGNGTTPAYITNSGTGAFADLGLNMLGDADLNTITTRPTHDATVLEFDFVPLGDSIKFRYVFSSEEYPDFACDIYNDAFAFFIQGPGYPVKTNIALVPGTNSPVTIDNINDVAGCALYPQFYTLNKTNTFFTHNGHTKVFTAKAQVQPCQIYHLKLVIADVGDDALDSGVFLEAKSLSSNAYSLTNLTQTDASGNSYIVEGCLSGAVKIQRAIARPTPETVLLAYGGTALNSIDVQTMPTSIVIPANQTSALLNIVPIVDNLPEGIETFKVYTISACGNGVPSDSTTIQIRDYDILQLSPGMAPDTAYICRNGSQQLTASAGYATYLWDANTTLNTFNSQTPIATPVTNTVTYYCTATLGTCNARDSLNLKWKHFSLGSKTDINCAGSATGQIKVLAGKSNEWQAPLEFWYGSNPHQSDSTFNNLVAGTYVIKIKDATGCIDSLSVSLVDLFPDLTLSATGVDPTCLGGANGSITATGGGGKPGYTYALDGGGFQNSNTFPAGTGPHTIVVKDQNGCTKSITKTLTFVNTVTLVKDPEPLICEGTSATLHVTTNAVSIEWTPLQTLANATTNSPVASPSVTTKYYVKAITGICFLRDSIIVNVNPAPIADAGMPLTICNGATSQLHGSGGVEYLWRPSTNLSAVNVADPLVGNSFSTITYFLKIKDANGCYSLVDGSVKLNVTPVVKILARKDTSVALGQPVQLFVSEISNAGITSYLWSPPYGLSNVTSSTPVATLDRDIIYFVTGKTPNNCEGKDSITIKAYKGPQIYVPNAFSPNGDNLNDRLRPLAFGMKEYHYFRIYNRFGQMIYETADFNKGWDGKFGGLNQPEGTYVWIAEAVDYLGNLISRKGTTLLLK